MRPNRKCRLFDGRTFGSPPRDHRAGVSATIDYIDSGTAVHRRTGHDGWSQMGASPTMTGDPSCKASVDAIDLPGLEALDAAAVGERRAGRGDGLEAAEERPEGRHRLDQ